MSKGGTHLFFNGMSWPNPADPHEVQYALRYGTPTREQLLLAATFIGAYQQLVEDPRRVRDQKVAGIRRACSSAGERA